MTSALRWTSADLETLPDTEGSRYEIIDGELYMSKQPHWHHQDTCGNIYAELRAWSIKTGLGQAIFAPGIIFDDDEDVIPDVAWISWERRASALGADGKLHAAPELAVEVLSPGATNERRDRQAKLKLYSGRGVHEYWIADWRTQQVAVYRRHEAALQIVATLFATDDLESPLLPGFTLKIAALFENIERDTNA